MSCVKESQFAIMTEHKRYATAGKLESPSETVREPELFLQRYRLYDPSRTRRQKDITTGLKSGVGKQKAGSHTPKSAS